LIEKLNNDKKINGILVQLPVPKHINEETIINAIKPEKDVDAFHPVNVGKIMVGNFDFVPCTPAGVMELIKESGISVEGKECVIVGRSNIVGKPQAMLLLHQNGTVTICHSRTKNLKEKTLQADILVAAVGIPEFIKGDMIKPGAVVIDVGINRIADKKLVGDVEFESAQKVASAITPVPGGVGPMTIAMLMKNTVKAALIQQ
ncbi:MAG: bifunctional 5,10-methylenetetrahydrofolate dehydrogenase/5,10-methenyltetrahydrofolate cyclohydrolase, partial [Clostridia bacterium]|nr:bifunctional 5,10-methylenetetrahydrofolate dehydrogenase/5,10-methenyltetrahydrofolate cyclohydrolase [Clostridia bacterium]